ncbi:hypothetical protein [Sphingomonas koreensis]
MIVDWSAVGAIATVAAALVAYLELRVRRLESKAPKLVTYKRHEVRGALPDFIGDDRGRTLTCERFEIENKSKRDLQNIAMRISPIVNVWSAEVRSAKKLSESAVKTTREEKSILIEMADMPVSELIEIDVISRDYYMDYKRLRSENSNIDLREE